MAMSKLNIRLELKALQITGSTEGEEGVYARLLADRDLKATVDVRYFGYNRQRKRYRETRKGLIFNQEQLKVLIAHLTTLQDEILRKGLA